MLFVVFVEISYLLGTHPVRGAEQTIKDRVTRSCGVVSRVQGTKRLTTVVVQILSSKATSYTVLVRVLHRGFMKRDRETRPSQRAKELT